MIKITLLALLLSSCAHKAHKTTIGTKLNNYREKMSSTIKDDQKITKKVFKQTCGSVKKRIIKYKKKGISIKQISHKNRNPNHKVPKELREYYNEFLNNTDLNQKTVNYMNKEISLERIPVQSSCLKCHGEKEKRAKFIKKKYPHDKAFGFKEGQLRGLYIIDKN